VVDAVPAFRWACDFAVAAFVVAGVIVGVAIVAGVECVVGGFGPLYVCVGYEESSGSDGWWSCGCGHTAVPRVVFGHFR
jgi:hypothetical protein